MSHQINIWQREHDKQWCVCILVPTWDEKRPKEETFRRERHLFPDLALALDYLTRRLGK